MSIRLLIADDEEVVRNGIMKYIQLHTDRFEKIYTAENGEAALEVILRYKPEVMLLDVQMPVQNGLEVMREAKKAGVLPATIIFSGYDEFAYCQEAIRQGAVDYMLKPSRSSDIYKRIQEIADTMEPCEEPGDQRRTEHNDLMGRAKEYIDDHYFEPISQTKVAEVIGITPGYLSTLFTKSYNCGFADYLNEVRIHHACAYLRQNYFKTYEIAFKVGFRDEKYFSKVFKKITGMSPKNYRNGTFENSPPF